MSISCIDARAGRTRPFNEYSSAEWPSPGRVGVLRSGAELLERDGELLARRGILNLGLAVGDAHRVVPDEDEQPPVVSDEIADTHVSRSRGPAGRSHRRDRRSGAAPGSLDLRYS